MGQNEISPSTIYEYYVERQQEFNRLTNQLKICCCFPTRRKIKIRLEQLHIILSRDYTIPKQELVNTLGIKYRELKKYPELIEINRKRRELKRLVA